MVRRDDVADWVAREREPGTDDILTFGSRTMWNGLLEKGLVDEIHLVVGPAALVDGTRIFDAPTELTLMESRRFEGSDNILLRYATAQH